MVLSNFQTIESILKLGVLGMRGITLLNFQTIESILKRHSEEGSLSSEAKFPDY